MNIDTIYKICQSIVNKYKQGYFSPDEFNNFFNLAQKQYFNFLLGMPESYRPGYPLPTVGKMMNQTVIEKLSPFFRQYNVALSGGTSISFPSGLASIIEVNINGNPCRIKPIHKYANVLNDSIDVVTNTDPVCFIENGYIQVYPSSGWGSTDTLTMNYYIIPPDAVWGYTLDSNGLPVYNPGTSVDPIWMDNEYSEIIARTVSMVGINLSNPLVINYSDKMKLEG